MWIILCVKGYKAGFCWGMQQSVIFLPFFYCRRSRTPYNAPPSTGQAATQTSQSVPRKSLVK
ncbi:MAG: hypothetical protein E2599_12320 [Klebsiella sp.]|nr:hypothetical protein [Klebsiella sp.]